MPRLSKTASLHEKTVKMAAQRKPDLPKRRRAGKHSSTTRVVVRKWSDGVDALLVVYVRSEKIHHSQIEVISPTEIIIHPKKSR